MTTETSSPAESLPHQTVGQGQISEIRYRRLFESARHGILLLDASTRKIIDLNPYVTERFGYSRDELVGKDFLEIGLLKDVQSCTALFRELLETGYICAEDLPLLTKAGQTRLVEVESDVYDENGYAIIQLNLHELHGHKSHEDASARLAAIVESSDDAIISKTLDGIITTWNAGAQNLYGYTAEEAIGRHMSLLLPPNLPQEEEKILTRLRQGEHIRHFETRRVHKDGRVLDVSLSSAPLFNSAGEIVGASAIARDIFDLKQARHALEQSERLYHLLARNFPNGSVMLFDTELRLLLIEGRGLIHTDSERKALIGQPIEQVMQPVLTDSQRREIIQLYQFALKGHESLIEVAVRGRSRLVHIVPIRDEHQQIRGALGMSQDVTEKKQAEVELREREGRFRQLAENINEVFWMSDPASQEILYVNPAYEKVWGRTTQSLYQNPQSFTEAIHPADRAAHAVAMEKKFAEGVLDTEYRIVHPDGVVRWIWDRAFPVLNAVGEMYRVVGIAQDITERKQAEAALQKERDFSAAVLETVGSLVIVLDAQGHVMTFNRACEELTGYSFDEVRGQFIMDLVLAPEESPEVKRVFESITALQFPNQHENHWVTKDGGRRLISWSNTALLGENGQVAFVIGTGIDVTERRQAEADLQQAHQKLQQAHAELEQRVQERTEQLAQINRELRVEIIERQNAVGALHDAVRMLEQAKREAEEAKENAEQANRAKSEFLSRMSHELRTPLNSIIGFGQLLRRSSLDAKQNERLDLIVSAGRHLLELINEVLDLARVESGNLHFSLEPVRIFEVVEETLALIHPLAERQSITIDNEAATQNHFVLADRQRLKQVLLNLLSNAIKYNDEGGSVWIRSEETAQKQLRIEVSNTGQGIAPEHLSRLFAPFDRLGRENSHVEGTGLGLALSKRLIEAMNGSIGIESQLLGQTTFQITLSLVSDPRDTLKASVPDDSPSELLLRGEQQVLYIEDNLTNLKLIEDICTDLLPLHLIPAMQGGIGLELAREHHPDLILLDLHLPDMNGAEVLRRLQEDEATRDIPVVILSADATPSQIERLLTQGAKHYLTKPLDVGKFLIVLNELLRQSEVANARE